MSNVRFQVRASLLFAAVLISQIRVVHATEEPVQAKQLQALESYVESSCRKQLDERLATRSQQLPLPSMAKWLASLVDSSEYCSCAAKRLASGVTPELLRPESQPSLSALANRSGVECILPKFKFTFPTFCQGMLVDIADHIGKKEPAEAISKEFCECVQPEVEKVSVDNFNEFSKTSLRDYVVYQRSGVLPPTDNFSLIAAMNRCGISEIRSKMESK